MLITETVSDHITKTVTNRQCFPPLFRASEATTRKYCDSGYKLPLCTPVHPGRFLPAIARARGRYR